MRRIRAIPVPGRDISMGVSMAAAADVAPAAIPCQPAPTGLAWFSDLNGAFDQSAEAATVAAGPVLGVARVLGETCGEVIAWSTTWTPDVGPGGPPGMIEIGTDLIVYPISGTLPGELSVSATLGETSFGPILLTLIESTGGGACTANMDRLFWEPIIGESVHIEINAGIYENLGVYAADFTVLGSPETFVWCCECTVAWTISWWDFINEVWTDINVTTTGWHAWDGVDDQTMIFVGPDVRRPLVATARVDDFDIETPPRQAKFQLIATVTCGTAVFGPFTLNFNQTLGF